MLPPWSLSPPWRFSLLAWPWRRGGCWALERGRRWRRSPTQQARGSGGRGTRGLSGEWSGPRSGCDLSCRSRAEPSPAGEDTRPTTIGCCSGLWLQPPLFKNQQIENVDGCLCLDVRLVAKSQHVRQAKSLLGVSDFKLQTTFWPKIWLVYQVWDPYVNILPGCPDLPAYLSKWPRWASGNVVKHWPRDQKLDTLIFWAKLRTGRSLTIETQKLVNKIKFESH